jgi:Rha family phage regulatory protein
MNGQSNNPHIDSREIAELLGKPHNSLIKIIDKKIKTLNDGNIPSGSFFIERSYIDSAGRTLPCYLLTKIGCAMLADKITGIKSFLFTAAYTKHFDEIEAEELLNLAALTALTIEGMQQIDEKDEKNKAVETKYDVPRPDGWYSVTEIALKCGMFSIHGNPHIQAVACILNENIFIGDEHRRSKKTEYGDRQGRRDVYDSYAFIEVLQWLMDNECPEEIYGFNRTYYVEYFDNQD